MIAPSAVAWSAGSQIAVPGVAMYVAPKPAHPLPAGEYLFRFPQQRPIGVDLSAAPIGIRLELYSRVPVVFDRHPQGDWLSHAAASSSGRSLISVRCNTVR